MLKTIHKYQRSIVAIFISGLVCLSMLGFGVDFLTDRGNTRYAIRVGDAEIPYVDYRRARRNLEMTYRMQYGPQYPQFLEATGVNVAQQTVDRIVRTSLLEQTAKKFDMYTSPDEVRERIQEQFGGQFNKDLYLAQLQEMGISAAEFETKLAGDALNSQLIGFISDMSKASDRETRIRIEREETAYDISYLTIDPTTLTGEVQEPSDDALTEFFEENSTDYEVPARVSYSYVVFDPTNYEQAVELFPEDLEVYYDEHISDFTEDSKVKASMIFTALPTGGTVEERDKVRTTAEEVHAQAAAGEDFGALALKHSDDVTTKFTGGDLGWISPDAKEHGEAVKAAFAQGEVGIAPLVEAENGFYIVKVTDFKAREAKPFESVKAEIETILRKQEAPAFTSEAAFAKFDEWSAAGNSLKEFAAANSLEAKESNGLLSAEEDPDPMLAGLTEQVLSDPETEQQLVELKTKSVIVQRIEFKEEAMPPLADVREKVLVDYRKSRALGVARTKAEAVLAKANDPEGAEFATIAAESSLEVKKESDIKPSAPSSQGPLVDPEVRKAVFATAKAPTVVPEYLESQGKFYIVQVNSITPPSDDDVDSKLEQRRGFESQKSTQTAVAALLNQLKTNTEIDFAQGLLE